MHPQPNSLRSLMEYETRETERGNLVQPSEVASEGKAVAEEATPGRRGGSSCGRGPPVIGKPSSGRFSSGGRFFAAVYEDGRREELELCEIRRMLLPSPVDDALEEELVLRKRKLEEIFRRKVDPLTARASAAAATTAEGTERRGRHLSGLLVEEDVDSSTDSCESISAPTCNPALPQSMPLQALALPPSSPLLDGFTQLHQSEHSIALMRALWRHLEVLPLTVIRPSRCLRPQISYFDWTMLDTLTWPVFALEYFYLMGCIKGPDWKGFRYGITDKEYCSLPATMKLRILQILCDAVLESRELRRREYFTGISPPQANLRMVHSRYFRTPTRRDLQMLDGAIAPEESTSSSNNLSTDADMPNPSNDGNSDECRLCGMDGTLIAPTYAKIGTGIRGAEMFGTDPLEASSNIERVSRYYDQNDVPKVLRLVCSAEEYSSLYADICKEIAKHWAVPMDENCLQPERNGSAVTLQKQDSRGVKFLCDSAGKTDININADRENVSTITRSTVDNRALSNLDERANDAVTVVRRNQFCSAIADDVGQKLEKYIRGIAFSADWFMLFDDWLVEFPAAHARRGGLKCIWGINYSWNLNNPRTKQFAWRAAVEMSRSAAQLALQVRRLDAHIRWKDLVRPDLMPSEGRATESETSAFRNAVISGKQVVENKIRYALAFVVVKKGECVNGQMSSLKITQSDSTVEKYYGCPIPFPAVLSPGVQSKTRPRASKSEPRHRRSVFLNHGLVWKRKNDVESGEQFRLRHIIPRGGGDSDPLRRPICTLCFKDYNPSAVYIRCEKCSHWVHADAVLLEEDQMSNLIGYKCCKCRRKSSPRCPYEDPNYKKPERSQSGVALSWSQGELQLPKPIGVGQVHHLSSVNGVGSVAEVMLVAAEQGLDFRVSPGRTCPERYAFYPAQEAPRPPFSQQRGSSTPGMAFCSVEDASAAHLGNQLLNSAGVKLEDMESEPPQTYFSFTELLASEDDHLDELLDMPIGNVSGSWAEANADARIVPQGMAMDTDAGKGMEEPVASLPAVGDVPCQRCGSSDPPGDLTCETCGLSVHRACAPWTAAADTSAGGQWKCVGCRDWE
ncbi:unnamed protein product [Spirodela intermedia]|uniref:Zinc finger PHD-type domain-containing protein n=1 Tax=Spirodela intermedia TaxID=51605 RepID=A0A7I8JG94_SPIIN|nr:unnamed protein product [Spirodela intermedia]CAA6668533.1 unnamed protein product [Spirodela intermedia]